MGLCGSSEQTPVAPKDILNVDASHFQEITIIGKGGFGTVKAMVKSTGRDQHRVYAVKIMNKKDVFEKGGVDGLKTEYNTMKMTSKRRDGKTANFVLEMHYAFQDQSQLYLVLDLMTGGDMEWVMKQDKLTTVAAVKFYAAQMFCGIAELHERGIAHNDIKTENILLDKFGNLKIGDLGCASQFTPGEKFPSGPGTKAFASPEWHGGGNIDKRMADWFCYGVTLYHMLVGDLPWNGADKKTVVEGIDKLHSNKGGVGHIARKGTADEIRAANTFMLSFVMVDPEARIGAKHNAEIANGNYLKAYLDDMIKPSEKNNGTIIINKVAPYTPPPDIKDCNFDMTDQVSEMFGGEEKVIPPTAEQNEAFAFFEYATRRNKDSVVDFSNFRSSGSQWFA